MRAILLSLLAICGLSSHTTLLKADIAFSNLDQTAFGYFPMGSGVGFGPFGSGISLGQPFIVTGASPDYLLTDVQVPVSALPTPIFSAGLPEEFDIGIYSYTSAGPGSFIAGGGGIAPFTGDPPSGPTLITVPVSGTDPVLESGATYWIVMSGGYVDWWNTGVNSLPPIDLPYTPYQVWTSWGQGWNLGYYQFAAGNSPNSVNSGVQEFQVDGTPYTPVVPEPANLVFLVAIAFVAMALFRLRRRHTGRI
jgi:hypothetical protein